MDKFKKFLSVAGYVVAGILGLILYSQKYVDETPAPVPTVSEAPAID